MVNILLVDDEPIVRMGFKTVVDWNSLGFEIAGEAGNGREALDIFGKTGIDIVVTDIKMPIMDGIELISSVKNINPGVIVIVLSSYDDYVFVQKAFKLGIYDYVLKSDINEKNIHKLFKEIYESFSASAEKDVKQAEEVKAADEKEAGLEKLFRQLINKDSCEDPEENTKKLRELGWDIENKYTSLAVFSIYKYLEVKGKYDSQNIFKLNLYIKNIIEGAEGKFGNFFVTHIAENEFILIFSYPKSESLDKIREQITDTCSHIMLHAKRFMNINVVFGVSHVSTDKFADIKNLYNNAKCAQKYYFIDGASRIIWYYQIEKNELNENEQAINDYIEKFKKILFKDYIDDYDQMIKSVIVPRWNICGLCLESIKKLYSLYSMLLFEYIELSSVSEELKEAINKYIYLVKCESSLNELNTALKDILLNFRTFDVSGKNPVVEKVKRYANKNYNLPITSRDAAQAFDITQEHLCRLFANETGISFTKYIAELRIDKAKELLVQGNIKIKQVGSMVGYTNNYYFSKVFKGATGVTPTEYAKRHANAG